MTRPGPPAGPRFDLPDAADTAWRSLTDALAVIDPACKDDNRFTEDGRSSAADIAALGEVCSTGPVLAECAAFAENSAVPLGVGILGRGTPWLRPPARLRQVRARGGGMSGQYQPDLPYLMSVPFAPVAARTPSSASALTAAPPGKFVPEYGEPSISGDAALLTLGARRYGIPYGARVVPPDDDGQGRVVPVLVGDILHALTAAGQILNLTPEALAALGDVWLGRPDVRGPT
jgi:hypothetical protein